MRCLVNISCTIDTFTQKDLNVIQALGHAQILSLVHHGWSTSFENALKLLLSSLRLEIWILVASTELIYLLFAKLSAKSLRPLLSVCQWNWCLIVTAKDHSSRLLPRRIFFVLLLFQIRFIVSHGTWSGSKIFLCCKHGLITAHTFRWSVQIGVSWAACKSTHHFGTFFVCPRASLQVRVSRLCDSIAGPCRRPRPWIYINSWIMT